MSGAADLTSAELARWSRTGLLAALALLLGYLEVFVPLPLPGLKLGLANIPVLVALSHHDILAAASVAAIKVLATGLLFGSPLTMAYAVVGTALSFLVMAPISQLRTMRLWMASVVGALLHETGQLLVASALMGTPVIWRMSPLLFGLGCITGAISGVLAQHLANSLPRDAGLQQALPPIVPTKPRMVVSLGFVALLGFVVAVLRLLSTSALLGCLAAATLACLLARTRAKTLAAALLPCVSLALVTLCMELLSHGATRLAAVEALRAALRLFSIAGASLAFMSLVPRDDLVGLVAWLLLPLERAGVRTAGFLVALDVALRFAPAFVRAANRRWTKGATRLRPKELGTLLPAFVGDLLRDVAEGDGGKLAREADTDEA